jgi:hypothetical protein
MWSKLKLRFEITLTQQLWDVMETKTRIIASRKKKWDVPKTQTNAITLTQ